jgi:phosphoglycolate phosphatase
MILKAMSETGHRPATTLMIGDTTYDMEMARAADAGAIGVSWGYHRESELRDAGAHLIIDKFDELPLAIDRVLGEMSRAA